MVRSIITRAGSLFALALFAGQAITPVAAAAHDVEVTFPAAVVALEADQNLGQHIYDVSSHSVDLKANAVAFITHGASSTPLQPIASAELSDWHSKKEEARLAGSTAGGQAIDTMAVTQQPRHHLRC